MHRNQCTDGVKHFNHFLLTKFNTRSFENGGIGCDPEWLQRRFTLFDRFCYPSVQAQSNQNFNWLVFFDANTPPAFKDKIAQYANWQNFKPIYVDAVLPYGQFPNYMRDFVNQYITEGCEYLITTWLDNDDAIHQDYIQMIQDNFSEQESETLNFVFGYQLSAGKLYLDFELANHFMSLVERYQPDTFNTVLCRPHKQLYEVATSAKKLLCQPVWLEVVHDSNVMNVYRRGIRVPITPDLSKFSISNPNDVFLHEGLTTFLIDQWLSVMSTPYYLGRKLFKRLKKHHLNDLSIGNLQFYQPARQK
jgi:hypothetical protein